MELPLDKSLSQLSNTSVQVSPWDGYSEPNNPSILLRFTNGSILRADYWRVIEIARAGISSFDHGQKYGLPAQIDAIHELNDLLKDRTVVEIHLDRKTGDLLLEFEKDLLLQILNFTAYEVWEISFPDGTGEYSNYVK